MLLIVIICACAVLAILVGLFIFSITKNYRKLSKLKSVVKESYSTLEVFLEKRTEIVSKISAFFEEEDIKIPEVATIMNVLTQLKNNLDNPKRYSLEASFTITLDNAEKTLKNLHLENSNFVQLVYNLFEVQEDAKRARNYYNNTVEQYNKKLNTFPANISARLFKFKKEFYVKKMLERIYQYSIKDLTIYITKLAKIDSDTKSGNTTETSLELFLIEKEKSS